MRKTTLVSIALLALAATSSAQPRPAAPAPAPAPKPIVKTYEVSTVIDASTVVLDFDVIKLEKNARLTIIAQTLDLRRPLQIVGEGTEGSQGPAGQHVRWEPSGDHQDDDINGACPRTGANVSECRCDGATIPGMGGSGAQGSRVAILALNVKKATPAANITIDVAGGMQGPEGSPGMKSCGWNGRECTSPPCTNGSPRAHAASGSVVLRIGDKAAMDAISSAAVPKDASVDALQIASPAIFRKHVDNERSFVTKEKYTALPKP